MGSGLVFRQNYMKEAAAFEALAALLQYIFDIDVRPSLMLAGLDDSTMPFGYFDEHGCCVANFSVFSLPLIVDGIRVKAAAYQSGAVRPDYRGRGLYRDLMQRAFAFARETDHVADVLMTNKPTLYERYGFRQVRTFGFQAPSPALTKTRNSPCRSLSLEDADDLLFIGGMLDIRTAVSKRFAVERMKELFLLNAWWQRDTLQLTYVEDREAIIAWREEDGRLLIFDIIASEIPPLSEIFAALGQAFSCVECRFPTDLLQLPEARAIEDKPLHLMASSSLADRLNAAPVGFTPLADF